MIRVEAQGRVREGKRTSNVGICGRLIKGKSCACSENSRPGFRLGLANGAPWAAMGRPLSFLPPKARPWACPVQQFLMSLNFLA